MGVNNQASESLVIGSLINNLLWILEFSELKADYFRVDANRVIYGALKRLFTNGATSVDIIDIYALLEGSSKEVKMIEDVGGVEYLQTLSDIAYDKKLNDIKVHVKTIVDYAYKTELEHTLGEMQDYIKRNPNKDRVELSNTVEYELLDLKGKYGSSNKMELISNRMNKILQELEAEANREFSGFPTGFPLLDKYITYEKGEMVVYSAPAKFGKSQFVIDTVYRLCIKSKIPVAVIDSELSDRFFISRLISRITNLPFKFIKTGRYKDYDWAVEKFERAVEEISNSPLMHEYVVGWDRQQIKDELKRMKIQNNLQIVIWDYLKIDNIEQNKQERLELAMLTNFLKNDIGGDLNLAVVALAQTSDYSNTDGLRIFGSNQVKQYCSTVVYMVKKSEDEMVEDINGLQGNMYMFVKENRNGAQMTDENRGINFNFDKSRAIFEQSKFQHGDIIALPNEDIDDESDRLSSDNTTRKGSPVVKAIDEFDDEIDF